MDKILWAIVWAIVIAIIALIVSCLWAVSKFESLGDAIKEVNSWGETKAAQEDIDRANRLEQKLFEKGLEVPFQK